MQKQSTSRCLNEQFVNSWRPYAPQLFLKKKLWVANLKSLGGMGRPREVFEIKWSSLSWHELRYFWNLSLPDLWHFLLQNWKFGATPNQMHRTITLIQWPLLNTASFCQKLHLWTLSKPLIQRFSEHCYNRISLSLAGTMELPWHLHIDEEMDHNTKLSQFISNLVRQLFFRSGLILIGLSLRSKHVLIYKIPITQHKWILHSSILRLLKI